MSENFEEKKVEKIGLLRTLILGGLLMFITVKGHGVRMETPYSWTSMEKNRDYLIIR